MSRLAEDTGYCVACGGPFGNDPPATPWLGDAMILQREPCHCYYGDRAPCIFKAPPDDPEEVPEELEIVGPVKPIGGPFFRDRNDRSIPVYCTFHNDIYPGSWPFHIQCLGIANRVISYNNSLLARGLDPSLIGIKSLREMVEILWDRFETSIDKIANEYLRRRYSPLNYLCEPNDYYGYGGDVHEDYENNGHPPEQLPFIKAIPFPTENVTEFVLSKLKPLDRLLFEGSQRFWHRMDQLPQELLRQCSDLHPVKVLQLECTRLLPPRVWRDALLEENLLPWLWDLNSSKVPSEYMDNEAWDWELLVRQLTQVEPFKEEAAGNDTCYSLCNRRRIWLILEDMRFGDLFDPACDNPPGVEYPRDPGPWEQKHYPQGCPNATTYYLKNREHVPFSLWP